MRLALLLSSCAVLIAADWTEWRGPHRDGVLIAEPKAWPEKLKQKWKVTVGEGHASPILAGGSIFDFARQEGQETVLSIDPATGTVRWRQQYPAPYKMNPAAAGHGEGPKSTPLYSNGKLYTLGISGILSSFDVETGKLRWRKEFSKQYKATAPDFGTAMSPIVDGGLLIAHVGGPDSGALTGFDANTGDVKWSWNGDGPAYASPVIFEAGGVRQIVTQTQQNIVGVSASSGKLLWKIPFSTQYVQNIVTPLIYKDTLIFSGLDKGVMAVRLVRKGEDWSPETVWHNKDVSMYMNSPVLAGDLIFGFSHKNKGQLFCLNAQTGAMLWTGPPRQADNAAMLVSPSSLIVLKNDGEMLVAKPSGKSFELIRRYTVADSPTWAHPLVLADGVVIKDLKALTRWSVE
jgi:outer membrane protein assembly factor BamB